MIHADSIGCKGDTAGHGGVIIRGMVTARARSRVEAVAIRPLTADDAFSMAEAATESVSEIRPWMPWCHAGYSGEEADAFIHTTIAGFANGTGFEFGITCDGSFVGIVGINQVDRDNRRANVGYWVRSTMAGRGIATSAVRLAREWVFAKTDLIRLEILVAVGNRPSQRVAEKVGAVREGVLRQRLVLHGTAHDAVLFSMIRDGADRGAGSRCLHKTRSGGDQF